MMKRLGPHHRAKLQEMTSRINVVLNEIAKMHVEVFFQRFLPTLSFFCFLKCLQLTQLLHLVGLLVGLLFSFELIFQGAGSLCVTSCG